MSADLLVSVEASCRNIPGILFLTTSHLLFAKQGASAPGISLAIDSVAQLLQSPATSPKIQLKIVLKPTVSAGTDASSFVFEFATLDRRNLLKEKLGLLMSYYLSKIRPPSPRTFSRREQMLAASEDLHQLYDSFVRSSSGILTDAEFWLEHDKSTSLQSNVRPFQNRLAFRVPLPQTPPLSSAQSSGSAAIPSKISASQKQAIFLQQPKIWMAFKKLVPVAMREADFWSAYFRSSFFQQHASRSSATTATATTATATTATAATGGTSAVADGGGTGTGNEIDRLVQSIAEDDSNAVLSSSLSAAAPPSLVAASGATTGTEAVREKREEQLLRRLWNPDESYAEVYGIRNKGSLDGGHQNTIREKLIRDCNRHSFYALESMSILMPQAAAEKSDDATRRSQAATDAADATAGPVFLAVDEVAEDLEIRTTEQPIPMVLLQYGNPTDGMNAGDMCGTTDRQPHHLEDAPPWDPLEFARDLVVRSNRVRLDPKQQQQQQVQQLLLDGGSGGEADDEVLVRKIVLHVKELLFHLYRPSGTRGSSSERRRKIVDVLHEKARELREWKARRGSSAAGGAERHRLVATVNYVLNSMIEHALSVVS